MFLLQFRSTLTEWLDRAENATRSNKTTFENLNPDIDPHSDCRDQNLQPITIITLDSNIQLIKLYNEKFASDIAENLPHPHSVLHSALLAHQAVKAIDRKIRLKKVKEDRERIAKGQDQGQIRSSLRKIRSK